MMFLDNLQNLQNTDQLLNILQQFTSLKTSIFPAFPVYGSNIKRRHIESRFIAVFAKARKPPRNQMYGKRNFFKFGKY